MERKLCSQAKRALSIISTSVLKKDDLEMKEFDETCAVCIETYRYEMKLLVFGRGTFSKMLVIELPR